MCEDQGNNCSFLSLHYGFNVWVEYAEAIIMDGGAGKARGVLDRDWTAIAARVTTGRGRQTS